MTSVNRGTKKNSKDSLFSRYCKGCDSFQHVSEFKDDSVKLCRKCQNRDYQREYYKNKVRNGQYIYMLLNEQGDIMYIGSTNNKYRIAKHLGSNSHLKIMAEDWYKLGLAECIYANVDDLIESVAERYFLEKLFIERCEPLLNKDDDSLNVMIDDDRKWKFRYLVDKDLIEFQSLKIDRKKLQSNKVEGVVLGINVSN